MKLFSHKTALSLILTTTMLFGCTTDDHKDEAEGATTLSLNEPFQGVIEEVGDVDWAYYQVGDEDAILSVNLTNNTLRPDIELLITVYKKDEQGDLVRLYADHALEGSVLATDIEMNIAVAANDELYFAIRDLMDDEATDNAYYLNIDISSAEINVGTFDDAIELVIDDADSCVEEKIESIGDVDSYQFTVNTAGIYNVSTDFNESVGTSAVDLYIKLYDSDGSLIDSVQKEVDNNFPMIRYFAAGTYYLIVQDFGANNADLSSFYTTCVSSVESDETNANDDAESATTVEATEGNIEISGSLDHLSDEDWYQVAVTSSEEADLQVIDLTFSTTESSVLRPYLIEIVDADGVVLFSHEHNAISDDYHVQIKVDSSEYYIRVTSEGDELFTESASYTASITVNDVSDSGESGAGNDTIDTAIELTSSSTTETGWTEGLIAYKGDDDWYSVSFDRSQARILEVYLETETTSEVDYSVSVIRDSTEATMSDDNGEDAATSLKTSILVEAVDENDLESSDTITYYFKVSDDQSTASDAENGYRIRANVLDIPAALPENSVVGSDVIYFEETSEINDDTAQEVTSQLTTTTYYSFMANTQLLDFDGAEPTGSFSKVVDGNSTTFTSQWFGGYIDYLGDEDWFQIDLEPLYLAAIEDSETGELIEQDQDSEWYYDIQIEFYTADPGSAVEYIWKFYKDGQQNYILNDYQTDDNDGFFASAGDQSTEVASFNMVTPGEGQSFWVNQDWQGHFFFSVSDFDLVASELPDDDWGYDQPYYFRVTLIYHSGVSNAEQQAELESTTQE